MPDFEPATELNRALYSDVIAPLLVPWTHSAALLGWGSEILGFDTAPSTDHGWGPRLQIFVAPSDLDAARAAINTGLPDEFRGWPIRYGWDEVPAEHRIAVMDLGAFLEFQLGRDPRDGMTALDWLLTPQQLLLGVVGGAVYHDSLGDLTQVRRELAWYPDDVWRWMLACQWRRIENEEAFVGRAAEVGDELGSRIVAARLVRELMRLWFLLAREYWPYTKWFGSAFAHLPGADTLAPLLDHVLGAVDHATRESALVAAYELVARRHNHSEITEPVDATVRPFHTRPFQVLMSERFVAGTLDRVTDPWLRALPLVGSVDQVVDSTDVLPSPPAPTTSARSTRASGTPTSTASRNQPAHEASSRQPCLVNGTATPLSNPSRQTQADPRSRIARRVNTTRVPAARSCSPRRVGPRIGA